MNYLAGIKDVVDSSFNEIFVLEVVSFPMSIEIAKSYLDEHLLETKTPEIIASVVGGIPRELERAGHVANRAVATVDGLEHLLFSCTRHLQAG